MGANLTMLQKGLALIAIPLIFQMLLLGLYFQMRMKSDAAQEEALGSLHIRSEAEQVFRLLADAQNAVRGFVISRDEAFLGSQQEAAQEVPSRLDHLRGAVRDPAQKINASNIADAAGIFLAYLDDQIDLVRLGKEGRAAGIIAGGTGERLIDKLRTDLKAFLQRQSELDAQQEEILRATELRHDWMVGGMIGLSILLAMATTLVFSSVIGTRLNVLNENARRLAQGEELTTPMRGKDEIAQADRTFHDMAQAIRERTDALATSVASLQRSNQELEQFASVASHDLQEPLRKIQAFGDRLQTKFATVLGDQGRDYVERMLASAMRMRSLIDALLTYSRVTTKAQPFVPVDLGATARDVVSDLEGRLQANGGQVEVGELPTIAADPVQMRQLMQNLIGNGLKFHQPDTPPLVKVEGRLVDGADGSGAAQRCEITVHDNGIGFEERYLDRIFEVFQRLHGRNEYEGTGMGLAICRKIVERHGGAITAQSQPGAGATFLVTLPAPSSPEGSAA